MFDYSDDELVEGLMLDLRLQYALHTTSFTEQPLSDKTLSRFRRRCYDYEQTHGVDLYKAAIQNYNKEIAKMMELDGKIRRMDSLMINSNMRMLARSELIYSCISRLVTYIHSVKPEMLPETLLHYAQPNDFNKVFYHERSSTLEERMEQFLKDAETLYDITKTGFEDVSEYELFIRCFSEQSIVEQGKRRWITKEDNLGNSDSQFIKEHLEALPKQEENTSMIVDGAYYSEEAETMAAEKNIELLPTALTAKKNRRDVSGFEMDEEKTKVIKCPAGNTPRKRA